MRVDPVQLLAEIVKQGLVLNGYRPYYLPYVPAPDYPMRSRTHDWRACELTPTPSSIVSLANAWFWRVYGC